MKNVKSKRTKARHIAFVAIALGILLAALALIIAMRKPRASPPVANEALPSASRPKAEEIAAYTVLPELPKYISIPAIKLNDVRVIQLGVTKENRIAVPANVFDAGWYKESAKPGQPGAVFIFGHLSSWQTEGAFFNLKKLKRGDTATITRGDNRQFMFKVVDSKTYPVAQVPMNKVLSPVEIGKQGLNLMTCAGQVIKGTNDFSERLVVYMTLVDS